MRVWPWSLVRRIGKATEFIVAFGAMKGGALDDAGVGVLGAGAAAIRAPTPGLRFLRLQTGDRVNKADDATADGTDVLAPMPMGDLAGVGVDAARNPAQFLAQHAGRHQRADVPGGGIL